MKIKWLGHSCFKIKDSRGVRILTDPFDDNLGYKVPSVETDIVTVSHQHYDHNFTDCVNGDFEIIDKVGNFNINDIPITGIHTYHDSENGEKRGSNTIYIFEMDGIRVCHLGDLGHLLTESQLELIGKPDVILIPVGGTYTLDGEMAAEVSAQLDPKIIIPMHYKTPKLKLDIATAEDFISRMGGEVVPTQVIEINKELLENSSKKVMILRYE
jgi:L-ascorbate metabolism protein UlaG (beta-lactamase superfamily)